MRWLKTYKVCKLIVLWSEELQRRLNYTVQGHKSLNAGAKTKEGNADKCMDQAVEDGVSELISKS